MSFSQCCGLIEPRGGLPCFSHSSALARFAPRWGLSQSFPCWRAWRRPQRPGRAAPATPMADAHRAAPPSPRGRERRRVRSHRWHRGAWHRGGHRVVAEPQDLSDLRGSLRAGLRLRACAGGARHSLRGARLRAARPPSPSTAADVLPAHAAGLGPSRAAMARAPPSWRSPHLARGLASAAHPGGAGAPLTYSRRSSSASSCRCKAARRSSSPCRM